MTEKLYKKLKMALQEDYEIIRNVYKFYSTLDVSGEANCMS